MLSAVLKSQIAVEVSIKIIDSFVNMRKFLSQNSSIFARLEMIEEKQLKYKVGSDEKFDQIFKAIEDKTIIYTKNISKELELDLKKYNSQYPKIELKKFDLSHDRFLIIDDIEVYHFGASLKDLGKKWFAVSKMDINSFDMIGRLK